MATLINQWTAYNAITQFYGPYIDSIGNWYVVEFRRQQPDATKANYYIYKSTTSGSTWSQVANKQISNNTEAAYTDWSVQTVNQNDEIIVIVAMYDHVDWSDHYWRSETWKMNNVDTWGSSVTSVEGGDWSHWDLPIGLAIQREQNNYVVMTSEYVSLGKLRPRYTKSVDDTLQFNQLITSYPYDDFRYEILGVVNTEDDGFLFLWKHTSTSGSDAWIAWRKMDSSFTWTSGSGIIKTFVVDGTPYSAWNEYVEVPFTPIAPTKIDGVNVYGFSTYFDTGYPMPDKSFYGIGYFDIENTTSGSLFVYDTGIATHVESVLPDGASPEWIRFVTTGGANSTMREKDKYRSNLPITSYSIIPDTSYSGVGSIYKVMVAKNNKIYVWSYNTSYYRLHEVGTLPALSATIPASSHTISATFTSGSISGTALIAQPIQDSETTYWARDDSIQTKLYERIDETSPTNTDWISSRSTSGSSSLCRVKLNPVNANPSGGNGIIRYSYWLSSGESYKSTPSLKVRLVKIPEIPYTNYAVPYFGAIADACCTKGDTIFMYGDHSPPPSVLIDMDSATAHSCAGNNGCATSTEICWKLVDLSQPRSIKRLTVGLKWWEGTYAAHSNAWVWEYTLQYSTSGSNGPWTDVVTKTRTQALTQAEDNTEETTDFSPISARWWKLQNMHGYDGDAGWTLSSIQLLGDQASKTVIAEWTHTNVTSETPTEVEQILTAEQFSAMGIWNDIYLEFEQVDD